MKRRGESGFALLLVFVLASAIAIGLYLELPRVGFESQRAKEQVAIDRGSEYKRAIQLFYRKFRTYPQTLDDLEKSRNIRFLRRRYLDPMTGKEWRLIHVAPNGTLTDSLVQPANPLGSDKNKTTASAQPATDTTGVIANPGLNMANRRPSDRVLLPGQEQPVVPDDPNQPPNPQPGTPGQAGQPPDPNQPGQPPIPGQPQIPGQPPYPGQPGDPSQPQQPPYPSQPVYPAQPPYPTQPGQPQYPQPVPGYPPPPTFAPPGVPGQPGQPYNPFPQNPGQPPYPVQYPGQPFPGRAGFTPYPGAPGTPQIGGGQPLPGSAPNQAVNLIQQILTTPRQPPSGLGTLSGGSGGIAGVASNAEGEGIHLINERGKYKEWEFVYDLKNDKSAVGGVQLQQQLQQQQQQLQGLPGGPNGPGGPGGGGPAGQRVPLGPGVPGGPGLPQFPGRPPTGR